MQSTGLIDRNFGTCYRMHSVDRLPYFNYDTVQNKLFSLAELLFGIKIEVREQLFVLIIISYNQILREDILTGWMLGSIFVMGTYSN